MRQCPACELETLEKICPLDRTATLLVDLPDAIQPPALGSVLGGRYELTRRIASGGFARVFQARHLGTGAPIAVKVLMADGLKNPSVAFRRFFQEARITSRLQHPHIVRVFDFGQEDTGIAYLAMEMLTGTTLRTAMALVDQRGARWPWDLVVDIMLAIGRGLCEAHDFGLVHRDLTPCNIFLQRIGDTMMVRILDFGIAKVLEERKRLTALNKVLGTPRYMSPEQILDRPLDGSSDVYSLSVLGYELLAGRVPLQNAPDLHFARLTGAIPDVRKSRPDIPRALAEVLERGLSRYPENRYSALEMVRALEPLEGRSRPLAADPVRAETSAAPQEITVEPAAHTTMTRTCLNPTMTVPGRPRGLSGKAIMLMMLIAVVIGVGVGFGLVAQGHV